MPGEAHLLLGGEKAKMKGMLLPWRGPHEAIPWQPDFTGDPLHLSVCKRGRAHEHTGGITLVGHLREDINMIEGQ
jgi:hypothetical protein